MAVWPPFGGGVVGGHGRVAPVALDGVLARGGEGTEKGGRARIAANAPPVVAVVPYFLILFFCSFVLLRCSVPPCVAELVGRGCLVPLPLFRVCRVVSLMSWARGAPCPLGCVA